VVIGEGKSVMRVKPAVVGVPAIGRFSNRHHLFIVADPADISVTA
jgi:hypothetical protein